MRTSRVKLICANPTETGNSENNPLLKTDVEGRRLG